jgi:DNA-binding CsgD family transcriptional regulator
LNAIPGTLIFNLQGHLLYFNNEAILYLPVLQEPLQNSKGSPRLPKEILSLIDKTRAKMETDNIDSSREVDQSIMTGKNAHLILRSFAAGDPAQGKTGKIIVLLIEPATSETLMDIPKASGVFNLSSRETEVVRLICRGLTNKAIGELLFISDQTVKDHIKHLMRKMNVSSRTQIIATLLNLHKPEPPE